MTKLLCTGDWHIGAGSEYGRRPGDRLRDQRDVALRIADLALDEGVHGILIAGDIFEGPTMQPEHLEVVTAFLDRLRGLVPVLAISGNGKHDLAMRETNGLDVFRHIDGIQISSAPDVLKFAGCAVATLPWVHPRNLIAARDGGDRDEINEDVAQLLVEIAARGLEDCRRIAPGAPTILLGHWSVSGASLPNGLPVDQLREPVIPMGDLDALGLDHIVMGHIHRPATLGERGFYVGSPMCLSFGETGVGHGVAILHTDEHEDVDFYATEFRPIKSRPFVTLERDLVDADSHLANGWEDGLDFSGHDVEDAIVRVKFRATSDQARKLNIGAARIHLLAAGAAVVKIQPDIVREQRSRVAGVDEHLDELQALDLYLAANDVPIPLAAQMRERTRGYIETA